MMSQVTPSPCIGCLFGQAEVVVLLGLTVQKIIQALFFKGFQAGFQLILNDQPYLRDRNYFIIKNYPIDFFLDLIDQISSPGFSSDDPQLRLIRNMKIDLLSFNLDSKT